MQKPITKTFEFFEFAHAITANNINFIIKLWLIGNKEMQHMLGKYLKTLSDKNFNYGLQKKCEIMSLKKKQKILLLKKFPNVEYIKFTFNNHKTTDFIKYIPETIKALVLKNYNVGDSELKLLFCLKTLTLLKINAKNLTSASVFPQNLIKLKLSNCQDNNTSNFIEYNFPENLQYLNLTNLEIAKFKIKNLEELINLTLYIGNVETLVIENCPNLVMLRIIHQSLRYIPPSVLQLIKLKSLSLHNNNLIKIPYEISNLQNLRYLDLSKNKLVEISPAILTLSNLITLNLSQNNILKVFILNSKLKNLENLLLNFNKITELYIELPKLNNLEIFYNSIVQNEINIPKKTLIDMWHDLKNILIL